MTFYSLTNKHEFTLQGDFVGARKGAVAPVTVVNDEKRPAGLSFKTHTMLSVIQVLMSHRSQ